MSKKRTLYAAILLSLMLLLTACTSQNDVSTAVNFLDAMNSDNVEEALDYVCPERADEIVSGLFDTSALETASYDVQNVSCQARGDAVQCRYTIVQETLPEEPAENRPIQSERAVQFEIVDGKVCGFEEQVANDVP